MSSNINDTYTYSIYPNRPIRDLIPGKSIKRPISLQLTKDEVIHCMEYGPVYRVFPGKKPIRVIGSELDNLHKSAEDYEFAKNEAEPNNYTENKQIEQNQIEDVIRQVINEEPEAHDEIQKQEESVKEQVINDTLEVVEEEEKQLETKLTTASTGNNHQTVKINNNYNKKKKYNNNHH